MIVLLMCVCVCANFIHYITQQKNSNIYSKLQHLESSSNPNKKKKQFFLN